MTPEITALRTVARNRVAVELDGAPWLVLSDDVVVRAGLSVGLRLDRERLRTLARARRADLALSTARRALARRDHTAASLTERLRQKGVPVADAAAAVDQLGAVGAVDDRRYAEVRAGSLAERGYGDVYIEADLDRSGVAPGTIREAVEALEPEAARAARIVDRRGASLRVARLLSARGFSLEAVEELVASLGDERIR